MFNIFNMGIGMVLAVSAEDAPKVRAILKQSSQVASIIGHVRAGENIIR
jgi:phosphoribosylformylglycinamidine cyclo-ligase